VTSVKEFVSDYWPIAATALQGLLVWVAWSLRQVAKAEIAAVDTKFTDKFDDHDVRIQGVESRMATAEGDIKELPTKEDLARIEGEVKGVGIKVSTANAGIQRIENFFLQRGVDAR
jgi:hypothetical protein